MLLTCLFWQLLLAWPGFSIQGPSIVAEGILLLMGDGRLFSVIQSFFQVEPADTHGATETQEA